MSASEAFQDAAAVARYAEGPPRLVPGFHDMQQMAGLLLAESVPPDGSVLVLGAGGGLELCAFASAHPDWRMTGVDPSAAMLDLARQALAGSGARADLVLGTVDAAPDGPFDGASCLLTMPFIGEADRLATLTAIRYRLRPGAHMVMAHHSFPRGAQEDVQWMSRFAAFASLSGIDLPTERRAEMLARLTILPPQAEEDLLRRAGFRDVSLFYAALAFRGWLATA